MKKNIVALSLLFSGVGFGSTSITVRNFVNASEGLPIVDNTGAAIAIDQLSWAVGTFDSDFASGLGNLNTLTDDQVVLDAFTQSGPSGQFNFDGLFSRSINVDDDGALGESSTPLFVVISQTGVDAVQAMVVDFGLVFPAQVQGDANVPTQTLSADSVVFGGELVPLTDRGNIPAVFTYANGITFDSVAVIPEPSTSLLAGLAGLGLLARRRR